MLDKQRQDQYIKFKDSFFGHNQANTVQISVPDPVQDPDLDLILDRSRSFINKIKEHRHKNIKTKQIDKFERLYYKRPKDMDAIIISTDTTTVSTTSIIIPAV